MSKRIFMSFVVLCISLAACTQTIATPSQTPAATAAVEETPAAANSVTNSSQGLAPEDFIYSFLTAYEDNPDEMILYLDETLKESLPEGGIPELLGFSGTLQGLVFQAGSGSPDTDRATVEAHIQMDQQQIVRVFTLTRQGETWLITGITSKE